MSIYCILIKIRCVLYLFLGGAGGGYTLTFHNNLHGVASADLSFIVSSPVIRKIVNIAKTDKSYWGLFDFNTSRMSRFIAG